MLFYILNYAENYFMVNEILIIRMEGYHQQVLTVTFALS